MSFSVTPSLENLVTKTIGDYNALILCRTNFSQMQPTEETLQKDLEERKKFGISEKLNNYLQDFNNNIHSQMIDVKLKRDFIFLSQEESIKTLQTKIALGILKTAVSNEKYLQLYTLLLNPTISRLMTESKRSPSKNGDMYQTISDLCNECENKDLSELLESCIK